MGVVFKARQKGLNRDVALKMIKAGMLADDRQVRLFQIEAEAVAALDHPHIVPILDSGEHLGLLYYSMKLIDGQNLAECLDRFRDQPTAIARLMARIAEAIHHAHRARGPAPRPEAVEHPGGRTRRAACHRLRAGQAAGDAAADDESTTGHPVGTPSYMSPEQARGRRDAITTATDVYGLGTILYTLLDGPSAVPGASALEILRQVNDQEPRRPRDRNPRVDRDLETICLKCLEKEPRDRYASARELADDLNRWIDGRPIVARPASRVERAVKWVRRRPAIAALSAAVVIVTMSSASPASSGAGSAAVAARDEALESEDIARHLAYAAKLNLAERDWHDANVSQVRRQLDETQPPRGKSDLRGFEWYYLDRLCHSAGTGAHRPGDVVSSLAYSPDGRRLASGSRDHTITLWDTATGQAIRKMIAGPAGLCRRLPPGRQDRWPRRVRVRW